MGDIPRSPGGLGNVQIYAIGLHMTPSFLSPIILPCLIRNNFAI